MAAYGTPTYPTWAAGREIDHVTAARTHLATSFPEAHLAPSSVEMTLVESLAAMLGPVAMAYQRVPIAVVEHLMGFYGLRRYTGRRAVGKAKFTISTGTPEFQIPPGTRLRYVVGDNVGALDFYTTEAVTVLTSESRTIEVWMEAAENGTAYNGVPEGMPLDTVDYMLQVEAVEVSERTRAGEDAETAESFNTRAMAVLSRQTSALVYDDQVAAAAKAREEVGRAQAINNYNGLTGATTTGHITVAVTDTDGMGLPGEVKDAIRDELSAQVLASLVVHVIDFTYTTVNLSLTVEAATGANHAEVATAVSETLRARLDPLGWSGWNQITAYDITSWIDEVPGVARVISVPPLTTLPGVAPLPLPGTFSVTVNEATR